MRTGTDGAADSGGSGGTGERRRDRIILVGIVVEGRHGVGAEERAEPQPFEVDLSLELDLSRPGVTDDLGATVDYGLVVDDVRGVITGASAHLLEALAERIAAAVLGRHPAVEAVTVQVRKPRVPLPGRIASAGVEIRRERAARPSPA